MNIEKTFVQNTGKTEYTVKLTFTAECIKVFMQQKFSIDNWTGSFEVKFIEQQISKKTGHPLQFAKFCELLMAAFDKREDYCYVDILSSQDLENLRAKKTGEKKDKSQQPKHNKRYIILTYMNNDQRVNYPLPLAVFESENNPDKLKLLYKQIREQLDNQKLKVLNETSKSEQSGSFSINYEKKGSRNNDGSHVKEIDQLKSENQILKSKLKRIQEQAQKKAGSEVEAIIERKNELQKALQTPNMKLVDLRYAIEQQQQSFTESKQELIKLHKQISMLLTTDKEVKLKKHGEQIEKQLDQVRKNVNKNNTQIDRLKQTLEKAKIKNKELEQKAKKLNTEKDVIKRGRRGPYSSYSGSVRSGSSRGSSFGGSVTSKRSGYSYNSYKYR